MTVRGRGGACVEAGKDKTHLLPGYWWTDGCFSLFLPPFFKFSSSVIYSLPLISLPSPNLTLPHSLCACLFFPYYTCSSVLQFPLRGVFSCSPPHPGLLLPCFYFRILLSFILIFTIILHFPSPMRCCLASLDHLFLAPLARVIDR